MGSPPAAANAGAENEKGGGAGPYPLSYQHGALINQPPFDTEDERPTNEYVLNVAFFSFLGFMILQSVFALMVNSESMLADSEAMGVDAMTYLFNLCAERFKNATFSSQELQLSLEERQHKQKMKRHYLELIPPLLSVCTLLAVTIATMRDALHTLLEDEVDNIAGDDEKIGVMLLFSSLNLLLDVVNVTCFARADQAFGLMAIPSQNEFRESIRRASDDLSHLMHSKIPVVSHAEESNGIELHALSMDEATNNEESLDLVNLNMCSAWTHVCADTLRSIAVLVAAGISFLFDSVTPDAADAAAAMVVSCVIIVSLLPLLQGLYLTATEICISSRRRHQTIFEQQLVV